MGKKASTGLLLLLSLAGSSLIEDEPLSAAALPDDDGGEERDKPALPVVKVRVTPPPPTGDSEVYCGLWANEGHCDLNSDYMLHHCAGSCEQLVFREATILPGEDAAAGAFRYAEDFNQYKLEKFQFDILPISTVVDIAYALQAELTDLRPDYEVDEGIANCGKELCSADMLWRRAEDQMMEELYAEAGADLIRVLMKIGTEEDYNEKCIGLLDKAFQLVERQRQREFDEDQKNARQKIRRKKERVAVMEAEARRFEHKNSWIKFGERLIASLAASRVPGWWTKVISTFTQDGPQGGNCEETLAVIKIIPLKSKTVGIRLIELRCHELLGDPMSTLAVANEMTSGKVNGDPWQNKDFHTMVVTVGANAAMQLGLSGNASGFYQTAQEIDPEHSQYRLLKKVMELLNTTEEHIQEGDYEKALDSIDHCLSATRGLDAQSTLFLSSIQLKNCTILSNMGKDEEALANCDMAVETRLSNITVVDREAIQEAYLVRSDALQLDMDYEEALNDIRAAMDLIPQPADDSDHRYMEETQRLYNRLLTAMHRQKLYNGGEIDFKYNKHTGYPDGRPPERDHEKILQLPKKLKRRSKEGKCAWLKENFKRLARHYHPDKYKGSKKRAERKFKEVKEAKEYISRQWDC